MQEMSSRKAYEPDVVLGLEGRIAMRDFVFMPFMAFSGSGKTELIERLMSEGEQVISIEEMMGVKGVCLMSLFGGLEWGEHHVERELEQRLATFDKSRVVWVEWKPTAAQRVPVPAWFVDAVRSVTAWMLVEPFESRIKRLLNDYAALSDHLDYIVDGFADARLLPDVDIERLREYERYSDCEGMARFLLQRYFDPIYSFEMRRFRSIAWGSFDVQCGGLRDFQGTMVPVAAEADYRSIEELIR
jgi:tRNA 2-selenouridine synthase SelU